MLLSCIMVTRVCGGLCTTNWRTRYNRVYHSGSRVHVSYFVSACLVLCGHECLFNSCSSSCFLPVTKGFITLNKDSMEVMFVAFWTSKYDNDCVHYVITNTHEHCYRFSLTFTSMLTGTWFRIDPVPLQRSSRVANGEKSSTTSLF